MSTQNLLIQLKIWAANLSPRIQHLALEAKDLATNTKVAYGTGIGTSAAGAGTWFDFIPSDIGKLASVIGIILTTMLIGVNWSILINTRKKGKQDEERRELELQKLRTELNELETRNELVTRLAVHNIKEDGSRRITDNPLIKEKLDT